MKSKYIFPHKSRKSIIQYFTNHTQYQGWNHPSRGWSPFAWNVKIYNEDESGGWATKIHEPLDPLLNEEWEIYYKKNQFVIWDNVIEDCRNYYRKHYTTYPGDDQGDWEFCFGGRSGGWMILEKWRNTNFLSKFSRFEFLDWLDELSFSDLFTLYKAIRCMDVDFTREKMESNFNYNLSFYRVNWENNLKEEAVA